MRQGYIYISNNILPSLFAISMEEQAKGLMFREPPVPTMSFLYSSPRINKFWMQNTPAPLDIIFCCNGKINQICHGEPFSTKIIGSDDLSDLIIELPYGTTSSLELKINDCAGIVEPTQQELKTIFALNKFYF